MTADAVEPKLAEQLALLADACSAFDEGKHYQVKAISTRVYIVCHDLTRAPRWGNWIRRNEITFLSTSTPPFEANLIESHTPLVAMTMGQNVGFAALGSCPPPRNISFLRQAKWWEEQVIQVKRQRALSRKNLIFQMRNFDGGSHGFEKMPSEIYSEIAHDRGAGFQAFVNGRPVDVTVSAMEATVRQIAHEMLFSMVPHLNPELRAMVHYDLLWCPQGMTPVEFLVSRLER